MKQKIMDNALKSARKGRQMLRSLMDSPSRLREEHKQVCDTISAVKANPGADRHVLLTSTGVSNIGDQAMLESFISNVSGPIDLIMLSKSTYVLPDDPENRLRTVVLDSLVYGRGASRRTDLAQFVELLKSAKSFSAVGADIIDGGYQWRAPMMSWALATGAATAGIDSRVLGFSWGQEVAPIITEAATSAGAAGVKLFPRDPDSAARLRSSGVHPLRETVDTVFALRGEDASSANFERIVPALRERAQRFILMNISGLIAGRVDLTLDYLKIAAASASEGVKLVLIPHVDNRGGSDMAAVNRFSEALDREGIEHEVVSELLRPLQVRKLAREAEAVVTGRMHLSILALSVGTPAIVLSTQGKVSGLMTRVGHPEWCVEPVPGMSKDAIAALRGALSPVGRESLTGKPAELAAVAKANFEGLTLA